MSFVWYYVSNLCCSPPLSSLQDNKDSNDINDHVLDYNLALDSFEKENLNSKNLHDLLGVSWSTDTFSHLLGR